MNETKILFHIDARNSESFDISEESSENDFKKVNTESESYLSTYRSSDDFNLKSEIEQNNLIKKALRDRSVILSILFKGENSLHNYFRYSDELLDLKQKLSKNKEMNYTELSDNMIKVSYV